MFIKSYDRIKVKQIRYSQQLESVPTEPDKDLETSQEDLLDSMYERTKRYVQGGQPSFKYQADRQFQLYMEEDTSKRSPLAKKSQGKAFTQ